MSANAQTIDPPSKTLLLLEGRALGELAAFGATLPLLSLAPRGDGHCVLVFPGLIASDISTRPLRAFLTSRGYDVHGWGQGRNFGPRPGVEPRMRVSSPNMRAAAAPTRRARWAARCTRRPRFRPPPSSAAPTASAPGSA